MKNFLVLTLIIFLSASCGSKSAKDINVEELKDACSCVDAIEIVVDEMIEWKANVEKLQADIEDLDMEDLDPEMIAEFAMLGSVMNKIEKQCDDLGDSDDFDACDEDGLIQAKIEEIEDLF